MDVVITSIGQNKGAARVWLQGNQLARNGFEPGAKYTREIKDGAIVINRIEDGVDITTQPDGSVVKTRLSDGKVLGKLGDGVKVRQVSGRKKNDSLTPIIDVNNEEVGKIFEGLEKVRAILQKNKIRIVPRASEIRAKARLDRAKARVAAGLPLKVGSFAHGGGILSHALKKGCKLPTQLVLANEYREELVDHVIKHNSVWTPETIGLCGPMQEYAFDANLMQMVSTHIGDDGELDIIEAGIPCSGASVAGRAKRGLSMPEAHPEVGHLIAPFIALIARLNPSTVVLENVPQYLNTASMQILITMMRDMHYEVEITTVNGLDWNKHENRNRMVAIFYTKGMKLDINNLKRPERRELRLADIMEAIPADHPCWSKMEGLKAKEIRDKEAGKSFAMQIFDANSPYIATLTKGIPKNRSTDPKFRNPENPDLLRIPTALEHARAKGVPEELIAELSSTLAHEILGQSIIYDPFVSVGELIGESYMELHNRALAQEFTAKLLTDAVLARARQMERMKVH